MKSTKQQKSEDLIESLIVGFGEFALSILLILVIGMAMAIVIEFAWSF